MTSTGVEREARGDPRRSLEERYGSHAAYMAAVESAADDLLKARLLLPEDAAAYVARARAANPSSRWPAEGTDRSRRRGRLGAAPTRRGSPRISADSSSVLLETRGCVRLMTSVNSLVSGHG